MSNYIFRRRHKEWERIHYHNVSTGDSWTFSEDGKKMDTNVRLCDLPDDLYHPIEPYTGINDSKRNEQYPEGQMIFKGDIVLMKSGLYPERLKFVVDFERNLAQYCGFYNDDAHCLCCDCVDQIEVIGSVEE